MAAQRAAERTTKPVKVERVDEPAVRRSHHPVAVGSVHDPAEARADLMADRALALAAEYSGRDQTLTSDAAGSIHRSASNDIDGLAVDRSALDSARSAGKPLDTESRAKLESGFGTDLSAVRIHTGAPAADVARQISARAFTHGNDVFFGRDEYRPGTPDGDRVLAHEVAHTVQDGGGGLPAGADVHRYPATWRTSPVPWGPMTTDTFRPGEGVSGGVYIITSGDDFGPVKKAVVKPVFGSNALGRESAQQLQFSDVALGKMLGLRTPESKIVMKGGSEFNDLVALCRRKQPPPQEGQQAQDLASAESFVVMSEVPNASSIASLAEKAPTNQRAAADLHRAVFDPTFLSELGSLCVGDLILGNHDRLMLGAMNLGNVMVSMQKGRAKLAAIDTTALLPKKVDPKKWAEKAGHSGGHTDNLKNHMDAGPGETLDFFFARLVELVKGGATDADGAMPMWKVFETAYKSGRARHLGAFEFGWNDAMITALALANDEQKVDDMMAGYDDQDVTKSTLMAHLNYIGGRAEGKSHEESVGRSIAVTAKDWIDSIDQNRFTPPTSDALAPQNRAIPNKKVLSADVVDMPRLPPAIDVQKSLGGSKAQPLGPNRYAKFPSLRDDVKTADQGIDASVKSTKRRRGILGTKEIPNNKSLTSHYITYATAMGIGAARTADAAIYMKFANQNASALASGEYQGNEAGPVKSLLMHMGVAAPALSASVVSYQSALSGAAQAVESTSHAEATALAVALRAVDSYLEETVKALTVVRKVDFQRLASTIRTTPRR